ncbi:MAG: hypothetical protein ACFE8A_12390 [Candidatus Hodarchaeota archaeon]
MTIFSHEIFKLLLNNELNRKRGEYYSKKGRNYEDKACFYILERFNRITKVKSKIASFSFNGLEDLDIFDDKERIFSFQIKKTKNLWDKTDRRLYEFLQRCLKRNIKLKNSNKSLKVKYFFFTNKTGKFLENWKRLHRKEPDKLFDFLPVKLKNYLNKITKSDIIRKELLNNIYFIVGQRESFLDLYIEVKLLNKFKEFKNKFKPDDFVDFQLYNDVIFNERRLYYAKIYEPIWEQDILISNALEFNLNKRIIYYTEKSKGVSFNKIRYYLKRNNIFISFLFKFGKIYSFQNFDKNNPLTKFIKDNSYITEIEFEKLDKSDKITFLNDWIYNYLHYLNLNCYKKKNKRIFYFHCKNRDKIINWRDPKSRKKKEWKVVQNRGAYYLNLAAEISVNIYNDIYFIIISPRLLFSSNGENIFRSEEIRKIETKYRKSFMKNDFQRRWFYVFVSYIKQEEKQTEQTEIIKFFKKKPMKFEKYKKKKFFDINHAIFKDPLVIHANFKPNNESSSLIN